MKKTFALICTLAMLLTSIPTGAFELETVESSAETALETTTTAETSAEATLEALTITPGKNLLTGEATYLTFDNESDLALFDDHHGYQAPTIVEDTSVDTDGSHGKMFKMHRDANPGSHWGGYAINSVKFDGGRSYWFHFDEYWKIESPTELWGCFTNLYSGGHWNTGLNKTKHANVWRTFDYNQTPNKDATLYYQGKVTNVEIVEDQSNPTVETDLYLDNYALVPYYKITYKAASGDTVDQVLFADATKARSFDNLATEYTVKTDNYLSYGKDGYAYKQVGWATTEDATAADAVTTVALNGADITLYPIYETRQVLTYSLDDLWAAWNAIGTVTASEEVTWDYTVDIASTVNAGNRPTVTFSDDGLTATITGKGFNGYVTLTATTADGIALTKRVLVTGAGENMPGLNLFTNTLEGVDFDTITLKGANNVFANGTYNKIKDNANKSDANTSDKVLEITGGNYPSVWTRQFDEARQISTERPIYVSYDYYGSFGAHWLMINGSSASDIFKGVDGLGFKTTDTWKTMVFAKGLSTATNKYEKIRTLGIEIGSTAGNYIYVDNYKIIPWYKIDYIGLDGETIVATDYALCDDDGNILSAYAPKESIAKANGGVAVSLTKDGAKVTSIPFDNKDLTVYIIENAPVTYISGEDTTDVALTAGEAYTVPTVAELEFSAVENFVAWQDDAGDLYYPGDVIAAADLTEFMGKTLRPFVYDLSVPAVVTLAEGDKMPSVYDGPNGNFTYAELITDDGRNVLHLHQNHSTWGAQSGVKQWKADARFQYKCFDNPIDAENYTLVQYCYKATNVKDIDPRTTAYDDVTEDMIIDKTTAPMLIYYYTSTKGDGFYSPGGEHRVGGARTIICDGNYHVQEIDMGVASNGNTTAPWKDKVYGLAIDPAKVGWSADNYIDYIRVYRKGDFTVTYDSNFEEEGITVTDVAADTGRGLGTNYYLKGERPVLSGEGSEYYVFLGWALSEADADNGITTDVIPTFDRNTTVYAVWGDFDETPDVEADKLGIRSDYEYTKGVRFASTISNESRDLASEYGFIIAREDVLGTDELTFDFKNDKGVAQYAYGAAYDKANGIDKRFDETADGIIFSAVAVNVPAAHYATRLVARTYMKYDVTGKAVTLYGAAQTTSLKETAQSIKAEGGDAYETNKAYVEEILAATAD